MTRMEETEALRARTDVHYNCCQSVVLPFAEELGLDEEAVLKLAEHFGSGMRRGSVCGAVTGGAGRGAGGTPDFRRAAGRAGKGCRLH